MKHYAYIVDFVIVADVFIRASLPILEYSQFRQSILALPFCLYFTFKKIGS